MTRKQQNSAGVDRRDFIGAMAMAAGAASLLAQVTPAGAAQPGPAAGPGGAGVPRPAAGPPAPAVRQPPQLPDLKGKTAYVTGANTGIGLGIVRAAANAGMNVVMGYIQDNQVEPAMKLIKDDQKSRVIPIRHDVTDREGWVTLLKQINDKFGNLHLLVNNAGIKIGTQASRVDAKAWDSATAVNFTGVWNGCAAVIPHMLAHKEGSHIVTTASMGGILPGVNAGVYTATKFGAFGIMEALRVELMNTNIGTSVYSPGGVSTDNPKSDAGEEVAMMDPLEAGQRVLHGVKNNDLFIFTHPEFKAGMKERFDAILASVPDEPFPANRAAAELRVLTAVPYAPEIEHRKQKRPSYRS